MAKIWYSNCRRAVAPRAISGFSLPKSARVPVRKSSRSWLVRHGVRRSPVGHAWPTRVAPRELFVCAEVAARSLAENAVEVRRLDLACAGALDPHVLRGRALSPAATVAERDDAGVGEVDGRLLLGQDRLCVPPSACVDGAVPRDQLAAARAGRSRSGRRAPARSCRR